MASRRWTFFTAVAIGLFFAIYPLYVIRPFRHQGARELAAALVIARWAPWVTLLCAAAAVFHLSRLWRQSSRLPRAGLLAATAFAILAAVFARVNIYERMFHPNLSPHFVASAQAGIDDVDMVMSVRINGEARAYPIREMGYHHVVNDIAGGTPIVATY